MFKRKLLLADDSVTIQKVINLTFADEGIEVFTVGSGTAAIEKLAEVQPDLVLADVHMPGLTGYQVCEQIRQNEQFKNIPVMLLVGSFEPFDEDEARRAGANDYLTKPFQSIRQLVQKVNLLLDAESAVNIGAESASTASEAVSSNEAFPILAEPAAVFDKEPMSRAAVSSVTGSTNDFDNFTSNDVVDDEMIETISGNSFDSNRRDSGTFDSFTPAITTESSFSSDPVEQPLEEDISGEGDLATPDFSFINAQEELENSDARPIVEINSGELNQTDDAAFEASIYQIEDQSPSVADESTNFVPLEEASPVETFDQDEIAFEIVTDEEPEIFVASEVHFEANGKPADYESENFVSPNYSPLEVDNNVAEDEMSVLEIDLSNAGVIEPNDQDSVLDLQTDLAITDDEFETELAVENELSTGYVDQSLATSSFDLRTAGHSSEVNGPAGLQFSPEIIDALAQKVLERISDDVIERIVLKMKPEKFEAIMQKYLTKTER